MMYAYQQQKWLIDDEQMIRYVAEYVMLTEMG